MALSSELQSILLQKELPSHDYLFSLLDEVTSLLEEEICSYRPASSDGVAGSLIESSDQNPIIIVPDIHARPDFLLNILKFKIPSIGQTVLDALASKNISLVCVGDGFHTEKAHKERWFAALEDYLDEEFTGQAMTEEMKDNLSLLSALIELKISFPENFHFLKGNHENIMNKNGGGDYAFRKFADEGNMTRDFIHVYYGEDILYLISLYENALPLLFANPSCLISHAEPRRTYTRQELINARQNPLVVEGLTWTRNGEAESGCVVNIINEIFGFHGWNSEKATYFAGHTPVQGRYALRQSGRFVQIHNPLKQNIVIAYKDKKFNPDEDILGVKTNE